MKKSPKNIFFAYESGHPENKDAIHKAVKEFNAHQKKYRAKTWEDLTISGKVINKTIFDQIEKCDIFACDLTYLNHNVLFELGYAIGKGKKLLIFLNKNIHNAVEQYRSFKILSNIGYVHFENHKGILRELQNKVNVYNVLISQLVNLNQIKKNTHDIFYISSKSNTQAALELSDYLKSLSYKIITDDTSEVEYQTLIWYLTSLFKSNHIIIHLLPISYINSNYTNSESSFFAGLGLGLGKKTILVAQKPFKAPIDYSDILIEYDDAIDCLIKIEDWIKTHVEPFKITGKIKKLDIHKEEKKLNLIKLGIGCEIAEEEKNELLNYFIEIEAYRKSLEKTISIFVGQKGTGKSAVFIKLCDDLSKYNKNFNIIIKPDSDELLDNVELSNLYNNERSKKSFLFTVWAYVVYAKLIELIFSKIKNKNKPYYSPSKEEKAIIEFRNKYKDELHLNFYGAILKLSKIIGDDSLINNPSLLNHIYDYFITEAKNIIREYFKNEKYFSVNILADNLDKTWDFKNDLSLQSDMILSLFEFSSKLVKDIKAKNESEIKVNITIFLRKDIFDFILKNSREPDKLTVRAYEISWEKNEKILRKLIEKRFEYNLNLKSKEEIEKVWIDYFDFGNNRHPYDTIRKIIVSRPRDAIFFMSKLFESAVNEDHSKVNKKDLDYAIDAYSNFLQKNIVAEMKAEFPRIDELFNKLFLEYINEKIEFERFKQLVLSLNYTKEKFEKLIEILFKKKFIVCLVDGEKGIINNLSTLNYKLSEKKYLFFPKNKIFVIPNPQEYLLKQWKKIE
ncbi:hypothetical protein Calab_1038 [Caldithrix abyssi DSM 13497]|uniref:Uncharacterized protein n=1 Tax=Caldithrix abyssi DSM 13497 TaxID=880073 RepID=H1XVU4_CALAY|nr:hypothetical protein [Caldithrix abyssi]APF20856.1 hypothetical protein Cabys_4111 [Caldithrix abyssi DSM 13497]EHO40671.1 hypothetical protein Calab_1038 [Caldithrix abyssi DSM 13497]